MFRYDRIRELREKRKLTCKQIASIIGTKPQKYMRCERGEQDIPADMLIGLSRFYKVSVDYLLNVTDQPEPYER